MIIPSTSMGIQHYQPNLASLREEPQSSPHDPQIFIEFLRMAQFLQPHPYVAQSFQRAERPGSTSALVSAGDRMLSCAACCSSGQQLAAAILLSQSLMIVTSIIPAVAIIDTANAGCCCSSSSSCYAACCCSSSSSCCKLNSAAASRTQANTFCFLLRLSVRSDLPCECY